MTDTVYRTYRSVQNPSIQIPHYRPITHVVCDGDHPVQWCESERHALSCRDILEAHGDMFIKIHDVVPVPDAT